MTDFDRFRAVLAGVMTEPPTATEICEAVWLAGYVDRHPATAPPPVAGKPAPSAPFPAGPTVPPASASSLSPESASDDRSADVSAPEAGLHVEPVDGRSTASGSFRPFAVPAIPALSGQLALQRALRPLKKRVRSRYLVTLDEAATAENIADDRVRGASPLPGRTRVALRPAEERWLRLDIVVDTSPAMAIWREHATELERIMKQLGAFSTVQTWSLRLQTDRATIAPLGRPRDRRPPSAIYGVPGRQVILVVSDCCGQGWWRGTAGKTLAAWGRRAPVAIIQPLPERLWVRTAAPATPGTIRVSRPGLPSSQARFTPAADFSFAPGGGVAVPVVEVAAPWFAGWAATLAGTSSAAFPTAVTHLGGPVPTAPTQDSALTPEQRVLRFRASASPEAFRLAGYVAMTVPSIPVMRLVQQAVFGRRTPAHLAEVILSGLFRPDPAGLTFVDGVADLMLSTLTRSQSLSAAQILQNVSRLIDDQAGATSARFAALLSRPSEGVVAPDTAGPRFAVLSPNALARLAPSLPPPVHAPAESPHNRVVRRSSGTHLRRRLINDSNGEALLRKWVPAAEGGRDPHLYDLLDNEIIAMSRLRRAFRDGWPTELPQLVGYDADNEEPFVLLRPYTGRPAVDVAASFDGQQRRQFQIGMLRALHLIAAVEVVHGAVSLDTLRWDGAGVQLVDFESARTAGGSADPRDDVWSAAMIIRELTLGTPAADPADDPEHLRALLDGVFGPVGRRPTAADLLRRMRVDVPAILMADPDAALAEGRQRFTEASRRKREQFPSPAPVRPPAGLRRWFRRR